MNEIIIIGRRMAKGNYGIEHITDIQINWDGKVSIISKQYLIDLMKKYPSILTVYTINGTNKTPVEIVKTANTCYLKSKPNNTIFDNLLMLPEI